MIHQPVKQNLTIFDCKPVCFGRGGKGIAQQYKNLQPDCEWWWSASFWIWTCNHHQGTMNWKLHEEILQGNFRAAVHGLKFRRGGLMSQDNKPKDTCVSTTEWLWYFHIHAFLNCQATTSVRTDCELKPKVIYCSVIDWLCYVCLVGWKIYSEWIFFLFSCIFFSCGYLKLCYFWGSVVLLWCRSSESAKIWRTRPRVKFFFSIQALSFMFAQIWSSVSATDKRTDFYVPLEFVIILYRSGWFHFRVIHYSVAYNISFWGHNQPNSVVCRRNHKQP